MMAKVGASRRGMARPPGTRLVIVGFIAATVACFVLIVPGFQLWALSAGHPASYCLDAGIPKGMLRSPAEPQVNYSLSLVPLGINCEYVVPHLVPAQVEFHDLGTPFLLTGCLLGLAGVTVIAIGYRLRRHTQAHRRAHKTA